MHIGGTRTALSSLKPHPHWPLVLLAAEQSQKILLETFSDASALQLQKYAHTFAISMKLLVTFSHHHTASDEKSVE